MKLSEYTRTELDYLEIVCNFTPDELRLLELRCQNVPQEECAEQMNMSTATIKRKEKDIWNKIKREC